jgi:hypothetical protein
VVDALVAIVALTVEVVACRLGIVRIHRLQTAAAATNVRGRPSCILTIALNSFAVNISGASSVAVNMAALPHARSHALNHTGLIKSARVLQTIEERNCNGVGHGRATISPDCTTQSVYVSVLLQK